MRQKNIFIAISALLVLAWVVLLVIVYDRCSIKLFYATEGVALFSMFFLVYFYRKIITPLDTIATGLNLLREQDFSSRLSPVGQREADKIVDIFNRMMAQLKDERLRLREQNHFLDLLIQASPMGVVILDFDNRVTMINPSAKGMLNCDDSCLDRNIADIDIPLMQEIVSTKQGETRTIKISGIEVYSISRLTFQDRGFPHPFVLIERLTEQLHKAERNAYEKVIRMIAHEVNNTMGGITSILETAKDMLQTSTNETFANDTVEIGEAMQVCEERGRMLSSFITRFADVVKIPAPQLQQCDLNDSARYCARFMEGICREKGISLSMNLYNGSVPVNIDVTLFEQVLVNIVKNSIESIEKGGEIIISTTAQPATIVICDNGRGIGSDAAQQIFTPFFTTKSNGQGIGLMFTREVLAAHGCKFSLKTDEDGYTRFTIEFK